MTRDRRMKASDVFRESNFFLGEKVSFAEAMPTIKTLRIEVNQSKAGSGGNTSVYTDARPPGEYIDCDNPLCYNGGMSIGRVLRSMVYEGKTSDEGSDLCQGYEGSPQGRKKYRDCFRFFRWTVELEYKDEPPPSDG